MPRMNGREPRAWTKADAKKLDLQTLLKIVYWNKDRIDIFAPSGMTKGLLDSFEDVSINGPAIQLNMKAEKGTKEWEWMND